MEKTETPSYTNSPWFRNLLALFIMLAAVIGIYFIAKVYLGGKADGAPERIFTAILPLIATWVGTVLAFYFGRENFEAASRKYEKIISKLNPELLDDVAVRQIMISDKTMVSKQLSVVNKETVKDIVAFLDSINKSRLPILDEGKAKYIVHKSTFLEAMNKASTATPAAAASTTANTDNSANPDLTFANFASSYEKVITSFIEVDENVLLEKVKDKLSKESGISDVFVTDKNGKVMGWLTDTLILRYSSLNNNTSTKS